MKSMKRWGALASGVLGLLSGVAFGNERHFTQTYESATLPQGGKELELWLTPRWDRGDMGQYQRFDLRAEYEWGVLDRLQTSIYVNADIVTEGGTGTMASTGVDFSLSNEWKYRLLDPVADPVGLALYGELTAGLHEVELEAKLIADKQVGNLLIAFNLVGEHEWEFGPTEVEREVKAEGVLGVAYLFPLGGETHFSLGAEGRAEAIFSGDSGYESTTFFAGPTLGFATRGVWVTASFMPQLGSQKTAAFATEYPGALELHDHERYTARLLVGIHL